MFEGVCLTHVILAPGACGRVAPSCGRRLNSGSKPGKPGPAGQTGRSWWVMGTPIFEHPSNEFATFCCPRPPWIASGPPAAPRRTPAGVLKTQAEFLRKIKAPAGTYEAYPCHICIIGCLMCVFLSYWYAISIYIYIYILSSLYIYIYIIDGLIYI